MSTSRIERNPATQLSGRYDVAVVGGGITGVCLAREFAARGKAVLLVDKGDFGSGTSSATTKYLHGGIRYLEQYDVALVRESLRERRRLALAAPHLVIQRPFVLPVWEWTKPGRVLLGAGALAYDVLSFDRNKDMPKALNIRHPRWFSKKRTMQVIPWLQSSGLRGAVVITDTLNIHPERLLMALLLDAVALGAAAVNHAEVTGFELLETDDSKRSARIVGVKVHDSLSGEDYTVLADRVVNAGGPWVGDILQALGRPIGLSVQPSKGVHVLTHRHDDLVDVAVMARARNGRHVVVSPWQGRYLIGPTDTPVDASPDDVRVDADDVDQLLNVVNDCRNPEQQLSRADVDDTTIGIRPLINDISVDDSSKLSRRHQLRDHTEDGVAGLYSVTGGKWTTGRAIAEDVVNTVLGTSASPTMSRPAAGSAGWGADPAAVFDAVDRSFPNVNCGADVRANLARIYGIGAERVLQVVANRPELGQRVSDRPGCLDILAQVVVAITHEGAQTLDDIVQRRLVLGTLGAVPEQELLKIAKVAAPLLGWSDDGRSEVSAEVSRRERVRSLWLTA